MKTEMIGEYQARILIDACTEKRTTVKDRHKQCIGIQRMLNIFALPVVLPPSQKSMLVYCYFSLHILSALVMVILSTVKHLIWVAPNPKTSMILVSSCSWLCLIHWSQLLSQEWRISWGKNVIANEVKSYIRGLTVYDISSYLSWKVWNWFKIWPQYVSSIAICMQVWRGYRGYYDQ